MKVLVAQLCQLFCDPMDYSQPGSSAHGIFQAGIMEWVAILFYRGSSLSRDRTQVFCTAGRFFTLLSHKGNSFGMKLEINYKKKAEKIINILRLKNMLLDNCWVKEEDIKKRWQEYKDLYKKNLNDADNHDSVITHVEPDIVECEVK